jgi:ATP-dependent Lhr-like helicase
MRAIVATNSLEMGIDIGSIDEVVMIQSPPSITAALQRIGRAGHRVGDTSKGTLFPTHAHDFLEAAALAECIEARALEPLATLDNPLDVLAQIIVSMTASETWHVDVLYDLLRRSHPYRSLPREQFDLVVEMLAGRYAGSRVRDLKARVVYDRIEQTLRAAKGAVYALYNSGGTIPDRGYYHLRHNDTGALVGDLDEEFVWEAIVGQIFSLGTQHWQIKHITHNDVLAVPAKVASSSPPFWKAEGFNRSFFYSDRIGEFLERAEQRMADGEQAAFRPT